MQDAEKRKWARALLGRGHVLVQGFFTGEEERERKLRSSAGSGTRQFGSRRRRLRYDALGLKGRPGSTTERAAKRGGGVNMEELGRGGQGFGCAGARDTETIWEKNGDARCENATIVGLVGCTSMSVLCDGHSANNHRCPLQPLPINMTGIKLPNLCPRTWTLDILDDNICREKDRGIILCGMWSLWCSRNDRRHGKTPIEQRLAIDWAVDSCFHLMADRNPSTGFTERPTTEVWKRPPPGVLKINTDGAFSVDDGSGATGAVIRKSDGSFVAAKARASTWVASALMAETEACRDGVRLLPAGTQDRVVLETDTQQLVALWNSRHQQRSEIATLLEDIQELVAPLTSFSMQFVRRSANVAAHLCAKQVSANSPSLIWIDYPPSFLQRCLQSDCNLAV
ncbi:hypothetical protein EJB05_57860, partial [Eragrostis curvula]